MADMLIELRRYFPEEQFRVIFDVGANNGMMTKKISKIFNESHIFCFEPGPIAFSRLREATDELSKRVTLTAAALGPRSGRANLT